MMKRLPHLLLLVLSMVSCFQEDSSPANGIPFNGSGYRPIYATETELRNVIVTSAEALRAPGKIYSLNPYLFVNEIGKGVHIIDNTDPKNPENISFISIPGNYDIAAKGSWLYADNVTDLLVFDISNPLQPKLSKRIANAIPALSYPPYQSIYFECADASKGAIIGWEKVPMNVRPNCFR
jgi:hypothetical protein